MLDSCSNGAILTKVRAIFGQRLTAADYAQMARKKDVGEVAAYLKERSSYQKALGSIRETEVHRGQLEALLKKDTYYKYAALRRYDFSGNGFYDFILVRLEVEEILRRIATLNSGCRDAFIVDLPPYLLHRASFSLEALAGADSFEKLLSCLSGTPYQRLLSRLGLGAGERIDSLRCERALYGYYYQQLFQGIDRHFSGKTRLQLRQILQCEVDARNLETIFRMGRIYQKTPDEIRPLLYPYGGVLRGERLERVLRAGDTPGMLAAAGLGDPSQALGASFVELLTHSYQYRFEKKKLRFATDAPVAMYAFLTLRRIEVENIITVIEGVRYQIPQAEIMGLLIQ